jgi:hypothetical protein
VISVNNGTDPQGPDDYGYAELQCSPALILLLIYV